IATAIEGVFICSASAATTTAATALSRASSPLVARRSGAGTVGCTTGGVATGADCASTGTVARHAANSSTRVLRLRRVIGCGCPCMRWALCRREAPDGSAFADHVDARRRRECEGVAGERRVALPAAEADFGALAECVHDFHPRQAFARQ